MEIANITDQLNGFTEEVISAVELAENRGFTKDQAIAIVKIAVEDIKAEVMHHYHTNDWNVNVDVTKE